MQTFLVVRWSRIICPVLVLAIGTLLAGCGGGGGGGATGVSGVSPVPTTVAASSGGGSASISAGAEIKRAIALQSVSGSPGATVQMPVVANTIDAVAGIELYFTFDSSAVVPQVSALPNQVGGFTVRGHAAGRGLTVLLASATARVYASEQVLSIPFQILPGATTGTSQVNVSARFWSAAPAVLPSPEAASATVSVQGSRGRVRSVVATAFGYPRPSYVIAGYRFDQWVAATATFAGGYHVGEDASGGAGASVNAVAAGTVKHTRVRTSYGNVVVIEHTLPNGQNVCSVYGHMRSDLQVAVGTDVSQGQLLGYLGDTSQNGGWSPHLHFGIRDGGFYDGADGDGGWRYRGYAQDRGIVAQWYNPTDFIQSHASPSSDTEIGAGSSESQHFKDCYNRNGGAEQVGHPIDVGAGKVAHWWGSQRPVVIQDVDGAAGGRGGIIDNEGTAHSTAWWLHGSIWERYAQCGGPDSPLGRPCSDESDAARSPQGTTGRLNRFELGTIYWSQPHGAYGVYGVISSRYEALGGTASSYGFPTGVPYQSGGEWRQDFEGGTLGSNLPPNVPLADYPENGQVLSSRTVTFRFRDGGDPDNSPATSRNFAVEVRLLDGTVVAESGWIWATSWTWTAPSDGRFTWEVRAGDGLVGGPTTSRRVFVVETPAPTPTPDPVPTPSPTGGGTISRPPGDSNGDGQLTLDDLGMLLDYAMGALALDAAAISSCDLDGDGHLDIADAIIWLQRMAGLRVGP